MTAWAPELRVQLAAHPLLYPLLRTLGRARPVVRVPGRGVVVSSAELAREVLLDPETFASGGRTAAELWTPVFGPSMLFNLDGAGHRAMRRKLTDFFAPGYASRLCKDLLDEPVGRISAALGRGERVDLVDATCLTAGALANALIGFPVSGSEPEREGRLPRTGRQRNAGHRHAESGAVAPVRAPDGQGAGDRRADRRARPPARGRRATTTHRSAGCGCWVCPRSKRAAWHPPCC